MGLIWNGLWLMAFPSGRPCPESDGCPACPLARRGIGIIFGFALCSLARVGRQ